MRATVTEPASPADQSTESQPEHADSLCAGGHVTVLGGDHDGEPGVIPKPSDHSPTCTSTSAKTSASGREGTPSISTMACSFFSAPPISDPTERSEARPDPLSEIPPCLLS